MEWTSGTGERHVVEWDDTAGMLTSSRCLLLFYSTKINSEELGVGVIVLDSVDALVPMAEMQEELDSDFIGVLARKLSRFCRRITPMLKRYGVDFFAINQLREKIGGGGYSKKTSTSGGNGISFNSRIRMEFKSYKSDVEESDDGFADMTWVECNVIKNCQHFPFQKADIMLRFGGKIDLVMDLIQLGIKKSFTIIFYR